MAGFLPSRLYKGHNHGWEYHEAGAITPKIGMALTVTSGRLALADGTTKPTYIAMTHRDAAVTAGTVIPVIRVDTGALYDTTCSVAFTGVNVGDKVTLAADGLQVTATKEGGVAEVVAIDGTAAGSTITVRFTEEPEDTGGDNGDNNGGNNGDNNGGNNGDNNGGNNGDNNEPS